MIGGLIQEHPLKLKPGNQQQYLQLPPVEPMHISKNKKMQIMDPLQAVKEVFPSQPHQPQDIHNCQKTLSAQELQRINAGPKLIDFGSIYVKSTEHQTFWIRNETAQAIFVQLRTGEPQLIGTNGQAQVIQPGRQAGFTITLCSQQLLNFQTFVKYVINYQHEFIFEVKATIEPVKLTLSKNKIKLVFSDDNVRLFYLYNGSWSSRRRRSSS